MRVFYPSCAFLLVWQSRPSLLADSDADAGDSSEELRDAARAAEAADAAETAEAADAVGAFEAADAVDISLESIDQGA